LPQIAEKAVQVIGNSPCRIALLEFADFLSAAAATL
jgi:hypothetical protein